MDLQTKINFHEQSNNQIDYNSNVLLIGSCFSENIGNKLEYFKFRNFQNPFGILFHPFAIECLIENAVFNRNFSEKDVFIFNEIWHCFDAHSKLSSPSKKKLVDTLNNNIDLTHQLINKSTQIIVTLGTAWVYRNINTNQIVANCHKVPQQQFIKELLEVNTIHQSLTNIVELIRSINQYTSIIFTVSPVRHLKDGFIENTQSKSHLICAIHQLLSNSEESRNLNYFPSYEIMMDELRDYRFYAEDMIHPNRTAINYIWEKFQSVWISKDASITMDRVDAIQKGLQHKPFNPQSQSHQVFLQKLEALKEQLQSQFPHIVF
ncbi:GSCFA domain-containing protein [Hyunsoonleella aestuarii]|uniref:GSCFA domain-containing protein n=1 Tax=Hyunsoonleella aestuarii TaxID=912802 RepID=A0ABP8EAX2_9FLAO|nr:GSCFA domain-containing protein [Hyunsoonleella aestuarii]